MSIKKKILLTLAFVAVTLVVPAVILLLFVDALNYFAVYVVAFATILFAILGFIVISLFDMQSTLNKTVDELKMQNAAIAYKLTNSQADIPPDLVSTLENSANSNINATETTKVNLNPADPLVMPVVKKQVPAVEKKTDEGFDDFE